MSASEEKHVEQTVINDNVDICTNIENKSPESMIVDSIPNDSAIPEVKVMETNIEAKMQNHMEVEIKKEILDIPNDQCLTGEKQETSDITRNTRRNLGPNKEIIEEPEQGPDPQGFLSDLYGIFCGPQSKEDIEWLGPFSTNALFTEHKETSVRSAIAFLLGFIQENFTGPRREEGYEELMERIPTNLIKLVLRSDGEELNVNVRYVELFYCSKLIFDNVSKNYPECLIIKLWQMRLILVHQILLDELANSLYEEFKTLAEMLLTERNTFNNKEIEVLISLEISQGYLLFHRVQKCDEILQNICENYKIDLIVEGLLGLRTKFQVKPVPILCLKVDGAENLEISGDEISKSTTNLPVLLKHEDDTRLERIKFINEKDNEVMQMQNAVQALVLAKLQHILKSQPKDRLASEEIEPYINSLLYQKNGPLSIRLKTLLINIEQEKNSKRTIDRSLKQLEDISSILKNKERFSLKQRFQNFFSSNLPPFWEIRKLYGDVMVTLGLVKTALDVYIEIHAWEEVINCYNQLELKHKAAEIIQQEIEKHPTIKLYCLLGDATDDPSCYEIAWDMSQGTSSLAQRHWGNYYFAKKDYEAALPHLEKTVEINSLQEIQWLRLGYAAITLEKWELAVKAYVTYTHLEPNGFESWNNLAKALIKLGDKVRAHKVLQESLKCNFDNWKVWENFMAVSVDTGNFEDAIRSYERLSELKDNFVDYEVLEIIVKAIVQDLPDVKGNPSSRLKKTIVKIIGHQCIKYATNWKLWKLAAVLSDNALNKAQKLQKSFRVYIDNEKNWTLKKESNIEGVKLCLELCETSLAAIKDHSESEKSSINSQLSSARLSGQSCLTLIEKSDEKFAENTEMIKKLQELHGKLTEELKQRV
ncbi:tetratricopeptide repeat protein 27 isoform X2 [Condylostylus longicornis]|uniref:tetratricopeptide repeat protein 27 isoform X2 n=1 Tax=Condylostylus longicornis TaxID=2530218 RepID=UPI00244E0971|nr:tetratricopeptide repeat protein 27 isoform X2 [Condylostylus longicornis]